MRLHCLVSTLAAAAFTFCGCAGHFPSDAPLVEGERYIKKVDHAVLRPEAPEALYMFMVDELCLARSWNWGTYGGFRSGGAFAGNMNIEVTDFTIDRISTADAFVGLAFEPGVRTDRLTLLLDGIGFRHAAPATFKSRVGLFDVTMWTTMDLGDLVPGSLAFTCEYEPMFSSTPENLAERRATLAGKQKNGPGILEVAEVRIRCAIGGLDAWRALLRHSLEIEPGVFVLVDGPRVNVSESTEPGYEAIRFRVASLGAARAWLASRGMLASDGGAWLALDTKFSGGVAFEFCE